MKRVTFEFAYINLCKEKKEKKTKVNSIYKQLDEYQTNVYLTKTTH